MYSRRVQSVLLAAVTLCALCQAQLDVTPDQMQQAVDTLAARFSTIRNEGLGIDSLETTLREAEYTSVSLSDGDIATLLAQDAALLNSSISSVLNLFDRIQVAVSQATGTVTPVACCDEAAASSPVCAHFAEGVDPNADVINTLSTATLEGPQVSYGGLDGTIVLAPSINPAANCLPDDARLQPWFALEARGSSAPLEVVILLDILPTSGVQDGAVEYAVNAASLVLNSLTTADMVGLVVVDTSPITPTVIERIHGTSSLEVIPVCTDTIIELENFVTSITPTTTDASGVPYNRAFQTALSLFTSSTDTEKLLLHITTGASTTQLFTSLRDIQAEIAQYPNVNVQVYRSFDDTFTNYDNLATDGANGVFTLTSLLSTPSILGDFYSVNTTEILISNNAVTVGHTNTGNGNFLTLRTSVFDSTDTFIGVLYAFIPFNNLTGGLLAATEGRDFSYPFLVDENRVPLYHPLLPGESQENVLITDLEPEGVVSALLDSPVSTPTPVTKKHLVFTGALDSHSMTYRILPSSYYCTSMDDFTLCFVLADEERTLRTLNYDLVDVSSVYSSSSQPAPIYHDVMETVDSTQRCNYFCKQSVIDRVSFQLTTPSSPPDGYSSSLIDSLTQYIEGSGTLPDFVREGVAEEAALGLAVSSAWLDIDSNSSDYITRRHLATPTGLYLTFPPAHLISEFRPDLTEWYQSASAHASLLTLGTPHDDPLREGGVYTVSIGYALRAPSSPDDADLGDGGRPLAVVSGDITLDSLRVFVREALPRCEEEGVNCVIVDDSGNLVYEVESSAFTGEPLFLGGSPGGENDRLRSLLSNSPNPLFNKRQCTELFNVVLKSRRFYNLDTSLDNLYENPPGHCSKYLAQHIPSTNTFLIVYEDADCPSLCFCNDECLDCEELNPAACECPCNCTEDCQSVTGYPICPLILSQPSGYGRVETDIITSSSVSVPYCFNQQCNCRTDFESCFGVRECHWCEGEQKCAHITECCSLEQGRSCCTSDEEKRLEAFVATCLVIDTDCFQNPGQNVTCPIGAMTTPPPSSSNTSIIVAAVVGVFVGVVLTILIILLVVYYQCRKPDPAEATSRESAFDFSNKTAIAGGGGRPASEKARKGSKGDENGREEKQEVTPPKEDLTEDTTL